MKKKILVSIVIALLFGFFLLLGLFLYHVSINIVGDKLVYVNVGNDYEDDGFTANSLGIDISKYIYIENNIDTDKIGKYFINYSFNLLGFNYSAKRDILVIDSINPQIILVGNDTINLYVGEEYKELGYNAYDNYDGDLTEKVVVTNNVNINKEGTYNIEYYVDDSSNNSYSITRKVIVKRKIVYKPVCNNNNPIDKYICANNLSVSVGYYNLISGESYYYNKNQIYYGASLIKTLDALYLYDKNMVNDNINNYINMAISISDNNAHEYLINYIGKNNLREYGVSLGAKNVLTTEDNFGLTNVSDQIVYMKKLYNLTNNKNDELKKYFINSYGNFLKIDNVDVMHKYGYYGDYYHNVGIVLDDEPYIIVVLTSEAKKDYKNIINNISKMVYDFHMN